MRRQRLRGGYFCFGIVLACWFWAGPLLAQPTTAIDYPPSEVLTPAQRKDVNRSIDRALQWMASQQRSDGSFPTLRQGQPGVTGLCTLAFLAQGHLPNEGKYGKVLADALDYIAACQRQNGLLALAAPNGARITRNVDTSISIPANYSHALAGIALCESYGVAGQETSRKLQPVIENALKASFQMQDWPKDQAIDNGGWRYLHASAKVDADLSVTGWQLMFLRSAKGAGFDIQEERIDQAVGYVRRCFQKGQGSFAYKLDKKTNNRTSRGMAGAGILALAHSGLHHTDEAQQAGDWILKSGFQDYNAPGRLVRDRKSREGDRYFYGLLTCGQAMYQLGGRHWKEFFPPTAAVLVRNQNADGSWDAESHPKDRQWGNLFTTASAVLALSASNQLLPIFQR